MSNQNSTTNPTSGSTASPTIRNNNETLNIEQLIQTKTNFLLLLSDPQLIADYIQFSRSRRISKSSFALAFLLSMIILPYYIWFFSLYFSSQYYYDKWMNIIAISSTILLIILFQGLFLNGYACTSKLTNFSGFWSHHAREIVRLSLVLIIVLFGCSKFLFRVIYGQCSAFSHDSNCHCESSHHSPIPMDSMLTIVVIPPLLTFVTRELSSFVKLFTWIISLSTLIFSAIYLHSLQLAYLTFFYVIISLMLYFDTKRMNLTIFFMNQQLKEALTTNERNADELHATEMRHMIANVAHDLKTPLTSFVSGIELISQIIAEWSPKVQTFPFSNELEEMLSSISNCVRNMKTTNAFMLMTINRCIDYTKASKGFKLIPKCETIDLRETLFLPLNCLKDVQTRILITLEPISKAICPQIITDKQWLQENILCLLSNAVKYSPQNTLVKVRVKLTKFIDDGDNNSVVGASKSSKFIVIDESNSNSLTPSGSTNSISSSFSGISNDHHHEDLRNASRYLLFEVEDSGIGFTEEDSKHLFSQFKQTQRLAGGTGLGLYSLAKRLESLNGSYGCHPREDGIPGSLFWFAIPYRPDKPLANLSSTNSSKMDLHIDTSLPQSHSSDNTAGPSTTPNASTASIKSQGNHTPQVSGNASLGADVENLQILLVDDSPSIIKMTSMMLKRHGHAVTTACDGAEALKKINERLSQTPKPFDVVLMDLQMPVMDGLEATRRLRGLESSGMLPYCNLQAYHSSGDIMIEDDNMPLPRHIVIGVSANSDYETTQEAYKVGVDAFISKPFIIETFYNTYQQLKNPTKQSLMDHIDFYNSEDSLDEMRPHYCI